MHAGAEWNETQLLTLTGQPELAHKVRIAYLDYPLCGTLHLDW